MTGFGLVEECRKLEKDKGNVDWESINRPTIDIPLFKRFEGNNYRWMIACGEGSKIWNDD